MLKKAFEQKAVQVQHLIRQKQQQQQQQRQEDTAAVQADREARKCADSQKDSYKHLPVEQQQQHYAHSYQHYYKYYYQHFKQHQDFQAMQQQQQQQQLLLQQQQQQQQQVALNPAAEHAAVAQAPQDAQAQAMAVAAAGAVADLRAQQQQQQDGQVRTLHAFVVTSRTTVCGHAGSRFRGTQYLGVVCCGLGFSTRPTWAFRTVSPHHVDNVEHIICEFRLCPCLLAAKLPRRCIFAYLLRDAQHV